jgi:hypothetical protein
MLTLGKRQGTPLSIRLRSSAKEPLCTVTFPVLRMMLRGQSIGQTQKLRLVVSFCRTGCLQVALLRLLVLASEPGKLGGHDSFPRAKVRLAV